MDIRQLLNPEEPNHQQQHEHRPLFIRTYDSPFTQVYSNQSATSSSASSNDDCTTTTPWTFPRCNYATETQLLLQRHNRRMYVKERAFSCEICHKSFSRKDNLNQHVKIHENPNGYIGRRQGQEGRLKLFHDEMRGV